MDDYSTLAALISSSVLVVTGVAYFFGRLAPKMDDNERDKDAYTIDGLWFLLDYTLLPLVGIAIIEIITQSTTGTFLITLGLMLLLFIQVICIFLVTYSKKIAKDKEMFCQSHKGMIYTVLAWSSTTLSKNAFVRHLVISFEILALYVFVKLYLFRHVSLYFLNLDIPTNYRMEIYIILSSMVTFMSLIVARLFDSFEALEAQKKRLCSSKNDIEK